MEMNKVQLIHLNWEWQLIVIFAQLFFSFIISLANYMRLLYIKQCKEREKRRNQFEYKHIYIEWKNRLVKNNS